MTGKHNARDQITEKGQTPRVPQAQAFTLVGDGEMGLTLAAPEAGLKDFYSGITASCIDALTQQHTYGEPAHSGQSMTEGRRDWAAQTNQWPSSLKHHRPPPHPWPKSRNTNVGGCILQNETPSKLRF